VIPFVDGRPNKKAANISGTGKYLARDIGLLKAVAQ